MKKILFAILLFPILLQAQIVDVSSITRSAGATATLSTSVSSLNSFTANAGSPSASQNFTLTGSNLSGTVTVTAPTGYELSKDNSSWSNPLTYTPSGGNIPSQPVTVYARLTSSASGTPSGNIACTSTGAATRNVAVTGTVISSAPTINLSTTSLAPYTYTTGNPSSAQTYTISGANLTADVTVTPPSWIEVSGDGTTYQTGLTLTHSGTILSGQPLTIYSRGKGSNAAGAYSGNIAHTSTGATTQNIAVNGTVNSAGSTSAKFNFSNTTQAVTGWTNITSTGGTDQNFTDNPTGWVLKVYGTRQTGFFGTVYGDNTNGAASSTDALFPQAAVAGFFINALPSSFPAQGYLCELTGAPAGNYTIYAFGSVKSTYNNQISNPPFRCQFGPSGSDNVTTALNEQNNTTSHLTFSGTITAGQSIYFTVNPDPNGAPGASVINAVIFQKN